MIIVLYGIGDNRTARTSSSRIYLCVYEHKTNNTRSACQFIILLIRTLLILFVSLFLSFVCTLFIFSALYPHLNLYIQHTLHNMINNIYIIATVWPRVYIEITPVVLQLLIRRHNEMATFGRKSWPHIFFFQKNKKSFFRQIEIAIMYRQIGYYTLLLFTGPYTL